MIDPRSATTSTEADRDLFRQSTRHLLERHWPAERALEQADNPAEVQVIWQRLAAQGLGALGMPDCGGGMRELLLAMEELGRAACPAPVLEAFVANMALSGDVNSPWVEALLEQLRVGQAAFSVSFGAFDGDANAGEVAIEAIEASADGLQGRVRGTVCFVEGAATATHMLVFSRASAQPDTAAPFEWGALFELAPDTRMRVLPTPGLAVPSLSKMVLDESAVRLFRIEASRIRDLQRIVRMGLSARALGAAECAFELVVEHAKTRRQFGQPIGSFQAVQHKLADGLIDLSGVRQTLVAAAAAQDAGSSHWRLFAEVACANASRALRGVSLETHHAFGAIGYAEEHEAPRHFRRVHADVTRLGGVRLARQEISRMLLEEGQDLPDHDLGPAGNAFRHEVREWFARHWTEERQRAHAARPYAERRHDASFQRLMGTQGWHGVAWPKAFGGQERMLLEQLAFQEELEASGAPGEAQSLQAQSLIRFGTAAQRHKYLPAILRGEINFCLGYSEPEAGSDLASLRTKAVRDADEWVIDGEKCWNSSALFADYVWLAARTDTHARPQRKGISMFIVPMNTPGLTIRPSMAMHGRPFSSLFFDRVRVPADALVGAENEGWTILTAALAEERVLLGASANRTRRLFNQVIRLLRSSVGSLLGNDAAIRDRLGALAAQIEVARRLVMHSLVVAQTGKAPVHEAAIAKVYAGELAERFCETVLDILGMASTLSEQTSGALPEGGELEQFLRHSIMYVIGGGTAEIQRTLIATHGLGLPRQPVVDRSF